MVAFLDLELPSDDSEDSDYQDSKDSEEEDFEEKNWKERASGGIKLQQRVKEKRALKTLESMTREALQDLTHEPKVSQHDPLLEYHKPNFSHSKKDSMTPEDLFDYLDRAAPSVPSDIQKVKQVVRSAEKPPDSDAIRSGVSQLHSQDAIQRVKRVVKYAGQCYEIEEDVHRDSKTYQQLQKQKRRLGGALAGLDRIVDRESLMRFDEKNKKRRDPRRSTFARATTFSRPPRLFLLFAELRSLQGVTSIQKSRADWQAFKKTHQLPKTQQEGFLARQAFLAGVESAQYELSLEARRKRRLLTENHQ